MIDAAFGILNTCILRRQWTSSGQTGRICRPLVIKGQAGSSKGSFPWRTQDRGNHGIRAANSI
jgi:hypothetical protein